jgi:outer membrane protein OmpA-like peptidoglycan-associated protein
LRVLAVGTALLLFAHTGAALAQSGPFAPGWTLQPDASSLNFQSVKNATIVETSSFATFAGTIAPDGTATVTVALDSVDTKIDLRNVRMRFLFFETFTYPEARATMKIDPGVIDELAAKRRITLDLPFTLDLHGISKDYSAHVALTMISPDLVSVSSLSPISIAVANHNLDEGLQKLMEAAKVTIIPSGSVSFDFLFARNAGAGGVQVAAAPATGESAALETRGNFDTEACLGRFEILSRSGNIFFAPASARLDDASRNILAQVIDIVSRCPGMRIEIGGHTDSDGSERTNQVLSERRAQAVADYLVAHGIAADRFETRGYGEDHPIVPNDSPADKARNRRIEFRVLS